MLQHSFLNRNKIAVLLAVASIAFYISFAYDLVRTDYTKLILLYAALCFLFYKLVQTNKSNFKLLVAIAVVFRILFLFSIPNLSQDFYRFIWDGRMILEGFNPYLFTPESFISDGQYPVHQAQELYNGMGTLNASHYTNYPPIKQFIFGIAALFAEKSILGSAIVFRIFIIAADIGTLYFGKKLLEKLNMPVHKIFWYVLNPFIIIELTGNLHFEGIMIFFFVSGLYLLYSGKWKWAGLLFAMSISVKLIPLLLLPLCYQWFKSQKSGMLKLIGFYAIVGFVTLLLFVPFYSSEFIHNYTGTVALWFSNFEFNASLYYIARGIGYAITGYNEIAIIGTFIPIVVILIISGMTFFRTNKTFLQLISAMLLILTCYYFLSTTVHPWYLATLLIVSVFTDYKFPLVWSFMVVLSYYAYANGSENLWVVGVEYVVVFSAFIFEIFFSKHQENLNFQKPPSRLKNT